MFLAGSEVDVVVTASTLLDTTVTADSNGTVAFSFDIPADHPTGTYHVTLAGLAPDGTPKVISETLPIVAVSAGGQGNNNQGANDQGNLSKTGTDVMPMALIGVGVLVLGAGAVTATRRKRDKVDA